MIFWRCFFDSCFDEFFGLGLDISGRWRNIWVWLGSRLRLLHFFFLFLMEFIHQMLIRDNNSTLFVFFGWLWLALAFTFLDVFVDAVGRNNIFWRFFFSKIWNNFFINCLFENILFLRNRSTSFHVLFLVETGSLLSFFGFVEEGWHLLVLILDWRLLERRNRRSWLWFPRTSFRRSRWS